MSGYIGPIPVPQGIQNKETFTATAAQTTFNTNGYTDGAFINVYLNGVRLVNGTDYTATNGSDIVLTTGASADDVLDFETFNSFSLVSQTFDNLTTKNSTHEDTDGGRESALSFQGEQSGGEISTLAAIQASHDGTADDQKGDLIFKTNDGSDNNAPTERLRIDSNGSIVTATLGASNTHLGEGAGSSIASGGNENVLIGKDAGAALTTGDNNTAVGTEALATEDANGRNTAIGFQSLQTLNAGVDGENVAVGYRAGKAMTTGIMNTLVGTQAGDALTDADYNTVVGRNAMSNDTKGNRAVAVGYGALVNQNFTSSTDNYNIGVGFNAGEQITTGTHNTFVGGKAGDAITTSNSNIAIGYEALTAETSSNGNVAIGESALGSQNVGGSGDARNVAVGLLAGSEITDGTNNTCVGFLSGDDLTTGSQNVFVGYDTTSASGADGNQIVIGYNVDSIGGNYFTFGANAIGRVYNQFSSNASWTRTSDERIKKDIEANTDLGLAFINDLRTVTYKWKAPSEHPEEFKSYNAEQTEAAYTEKMYGFIAQEVKAAMDTHNITDFAGWHVTPESHGSQQGVSYEMFVMPLVKAVQELSAKVDALETENTAIKARLDALEAK